MYIKIVSFTSASNFYKIITNVLCTWTENQFVFFGTVNLSMKFINLIQINKNWKYEWKHCRTSWVQTLRETVTVEVIVLDLQTFLSACDIHVCDNLKCYWETNWESIWKISFVYFCRIILARLEYLEMTNNAKH